MKKILLFILSYFFFISLYGQSIGCYDTVMIHNSSYRNVSIFVPTDYNGSLSYPLIIGMHGGGGTVSDMRDMYYGFADSINAIVACPADPSFDMTVIGTTESFMKNLYNINDSMIFLSGHSLGGRSTLKYGLEYPDNFKGLIPLAPAIQSYNELVSNFYNFSNANGVNVCQIIGSLDYNFLGLFSLVYDSLVAYNANVDSLIKPGVDHLDNYFGSPEFDSDCIDCWNFIMNQPATAIRETDNTNHSILLYPNPTDDIFHIKAFDNIKSIQLYNTNGQLVKTDIEYGFNSTKINCQKLAQGIYHVLILDEKHQYFESMTISIIHH